MSEQSPTPIEKKLQKLELSAWRKSLYARINLAAAVPLFVGSSTRMVEALQNNKSLSESILGLMAVGVLGGTSVYNFTRSSADSHAASSLEASLALPQANSQPSELPSQTP